MVKGTDQDELQEGVSVRKHIHFLWPFFAGMCLVTGTLRDPPQKNTTADSDNKDSLWLIWVMEKSLGPSPSCQDSSVEVTPHPTVYCKTQGD